MILIYKKPLLWGFFVLEQISLGGKASCGKVMYFGYLLGNLDIAISLF